MPVGAAEPAGCAGRLWLSHTSRAGGWDLSQSHQNILHHFLVSSQPLELLPGAVWEGSCGRSAAAIPALPSQVIPDSDAHRAGLQEGDQVLSVNDVDFQDIEHSKVSTGMGESASFQPLSPAQNPWNPLSLFSRPWRS